MTDDNTTLGELKARAIHASTARHGAFGNLGFRPMRFNKPGDYVRLHCHNFDHNIIVFSGTFHIWGREVKNIDAPDHTLVMVPGEEWPEEGETWRFVGPEKEVVLRAPSLGLVRAGWAHKFLCVEGPGLAACAFAVRNTDGEVVTRMERWDGNSAFMGQPGRGGK